MTSLRQVHNEAGVSYTRDLDIAIELGLKMYEYFWRTEDGKTEGKHFVYVRNKRDLLTLINYWNRGNYHYWF